MALIGIGVGPGQPAVAGRTVSQFGFERFELSHDWLLYDAARSSPVTHVASAVRRASVQSIDVNRCKFAPGARALKALSAARESAPRQQEGLHSRILR